MNEKLQIEYYNKYLNEYVFENKIWNTDKIREDLKIFSMKLKAALKIALMDLKERYESERPYMISLAYAYGFEDSYFWIIVSTEEEYEKNLKKTEEKLSHSDEMYYRYCCEESCHWNMGESAFEMLNKDFNEIVESQEYDDSIEESFWDSPEFDDFYDELEETCLRSIEEIKSEGILEKLNLENILFQYYVREYYSEDKEIEMFKRLNNDNKQAVEEFSEWL